MVNVTWKIARRSNAQLPLAIVLALAVILVLLGKAQGGLFDRARMRVTDWMQPLLSSFYAPVAGFNRWMGSTDELFRVYQENLALKDENARLRQWRTMAVVMEGRAKRYQALLHAIPDPGINSVLAHVIGRASRPFLQTMVLDGGTTQGVKPGEAVVDASGMIGRIYLAGNHTSWVILLTDLNSRIPVSIASGNGHSIQAIMTGDNSAMPLLDTLSQIVTLHEGDQVISSGDGGLLPPGLAIGSLVKSSDGFRVALLANAASSEDVEVLGFRKAPDALPEVSDAQLPAVAAGLQPAPSPAARVTVPPLAMPLPPQAATPSRATPPVPNQPLDPNAVQPDGNE